MLYFCFFHFKDGGHLVLEISLLWCQKGRWYFHCLVGDDKNTREVFLYIYIYFFLFHPACEDGKTFLQSAQCDSKPAAVECYNPNPGLYQNVVHYTFNVHCSSKVWGHRLISSWNSVTTRLWNDDLEMLWSRSLRVLKNRSVKLCSTNTGTFQCLSTIVSNVWLKVIERIPRVQNSVRTC